MSDELQAPPTKTRWLIFSLACGVSFLLYLHRYTWGIVKAELATEYEWDKTTLGYLDSAFMFSYSIGQIPGGMLGDWFGPRTVLTVMILFWSGGMAGLVFARNLYEMIIYRLLFGLGQAGCYPNLSKITKAWFPPDIRSAVQGWVASFSGRMGGAVSYALFATVFMAYLGFTWRSATILFALLGVIVAVLFWLLFRNSPRVHPWANASEVDLILKGDGDAGHVSHSRLSWSVALRSINLWMLMFQQFTCAFVDNVFSAWIPLFLVEQRDLNISEAGMMAAMPLIGGALGGMVGGSLQNELIRRTGNRRWSRRGVGLTGNLLSTVLMLAVVGVSSHFAIIATFFFLKFFADWAQPTTWATATDIGGSNTASVFASINTAGSIAGFVAGPIMGGIVDYFSGGDPKSSTGWSVLFGTLSVVYLVSALSWLWIDCEHPLESPTDSSSDRT